MDQNQKLLKAAHQGDVQQLNDILQEDPLALEKIEPLPSGETLVHVATLAGKAEFVKEMMKLNPEFARETNKLGHTPLHIASARGNVRIVKAILEVSPDLCLVKDEGTRTSLHYAALKGRRDVIRELLVKCPECAKEVTDREETALHLAVKNSQFDALEALLKGLGENSDILNARDVEGLTVLDVAVANDQLQASELLNKNSSETGDRKNSLEGKEHGEDKNELKQRIRNQRMEEEEAEKEEKKKELEEEKNELMGPAEVVFQNVSRGLDERAAFVASLLASVTYTTGLSPPPNLWAENMSLSLRCLQHKTYATKHTDPVDVCPSRLYLVFIAFNTSGFLSAMLLSFLYRGTRYARVLLASALCFLVLSYFSLSISLTPNIFGVMVIGSTTVVSFILVLILVHLLKNVFKSIIRLVIRGLVKLHVL